MIDKLIIGRSDLYCGLLSLFLIVVLNPFYVWGNFQVIYVSWLVLIVLCAPFFNGLFSKKKVAISSVVLTLVALYYLLKGASIVGALAFAVGVSFIYCLKDRYILRVYGFLKSSYALLLFPGLVIWVLHILLGNHLLYMGHVSPDIIPNKLKAEAGHGYAMYPFTIVLDYMLDRPFYRFSGPFDEPGVVGTVSALLLAVRKFKFKGKADYIILFSGIVSMSLAFYVISFIYFLTASLARPRYLVIGIFFGLSVLSIASLNETVRKHTLDRIAIEDGRWAGDNRSTQHLDNLFEAWLHGDYHDLLLGMPEYIEDGSASWKLIPVKTGLVGVLILVSILFILYRSAASRSHGVYLLAFVSVFVASIYQRPDVITPLFVLILLAGLLSSNDYVVLEGPPD